MDELTNVLAGSFAVSNMPNTTAAPHPRFSQYKSKNIGINQEERRKKYLELQKEKRFDFVNYVRCLTDDVWEDLEEDEQDSEDTEAMDVDKLRLKNPGRHYKNQLMLSEWMLEVPHNFSTDWLMVLCPVGKRSLVIASSGCTKSYARNGYHTNTFPSALPGGSRHKGRTGYTVLDCIYSEANRTFYVLDVMCWGHPLYDCETDFRFCWMHSKFQETPDASEVNKYNPLRFEVLQNFPCSEESIQNVINTEINFELDGLLFYHKHSHYTFGASPLVVWLKAYMVPEILGIKIPESLTALAPSSYTSFESHAVAVRKRQKDREEGQTKQNGDTETMDSETIQDNDSSIANDNIRQQTS